MLLQEVVLCATAPTGPSASPGAIYLHDIQTGSSLASFKQTSAGSHCTGIVQSTNDQGGLILSSQPDKAILNVYNFQKDQIALRIVLPERLSCIAVDVHGHLCAGGTYHGRVYLWEMASGIMYNAWDAHYRQVTVLRFTPDGSCLVSGSEDSAVHVWSVSRLLDDGLQNEPPMPYCTLSDHTLPITDVVCGVGSFPQCRVLTSSIDHTVKLWDLLVSTHPLLTTFQFPKPISCLAWDPTERFFFAASHDDEGSVHRMNLFRQRKNNKSMKAIGGAGTADLVRAADERSGITKRLITAGSPVACLSISSASSWLLAGTEAGTVQIYDVLSHQFLRSISAHQDKGLRITTLATMLKPLDLLGHVSLNLGAGVKEGCGVYPKPVMPFMKMKDAKARDKKEVWMMISDGNDGDSGDHQGLRESIIQEQSFFIRNKTAAEGADNSSSTEVISLLEQLGRAKAINDSMWERIVQKVVLEGKSKESDSGAEQLAEDERSRKRSRS